MSQSTCFAAPTLVRLLARLAELDVPESKQAFAERLSQWLNWSDAISVSAALNGSPAATATDRPGAPWTPSAAEHEFTRVRNALVKSVTEASLSQADFSPYRRHYIARQQAMEGSIGPLRGRLRSTLAATSPAMARLAEMDAVMEQMLSARERSLLSAVPVLLEKRFERLRKAQEAAPVNARARDEPDKGFQPGDWLGAFRQDMQGVLLAELDIRMQPVEGLLAALRMRQPGRHE